VAATVVDAVVIFNLYEFFKIDPVNDLAGTTIKNIQPRSYNKEISLCLRYFEKTMNLSFRPLIGTLLGSFFAATPLNSRTLSYQYSVRKRGTPTVTAYSPLTGVLNTVDHGGQQTVTSYPNIGETTTQATWASGTQGNFARANFVIDADF